MRVTSEAHVIESSICMANHANNFKNFVRIVKSKKKAKEDAANASDNALRQAGVLVWRV